jgi:predicted amidohydrolase YtcJ
MTADTIYLGGPILTMQGDTPQYAAALAVRDGPNPSAGGSG